MMDFLVKDHEHSVLPEGNWEMVWNDEFDGKELDRSKWDYRLHMMGQRWMSWTDKGVHLDGNSNAVFTLLNEDGQLRCSQLQTGYNFMDAPSNKEFTINTTDEGGEKLKWKIGPMKKSMFLHGPGYYECRCRLQQKEGWWCAFWIQSPVIGCDLDEKVSGVEIDILESFKPGKIQYHNVFARGYGEDMIRYKVGGFEGASTEEFHRFGLLWDETGYTFYVDGKEDGKIEQLVTARPEFILLSTEVKGYRKTFKPVPEAWDSVGDTFLVDYVRVFEKK